MGRLPLALQQSWILEDGRAAAQQGSEGTCVAWEENTSGRVRAAAKGWGIEWQCVIESTVGRATGLQSSDRHLSDG